MLPLPGFAVEASLPWSGGKPPLFMLSEYLCCFPDGSMCPSYGHDPGILKLDMVTQVHAVLSHSWFVQIIC